MFKTIARRSWHAFNAQFNPRNAQVRLPLVAILAIAGMSGVGVTVGTLELSQIFSKRAPTVVQMPAFNPAKYTTIGDCLNAAGGIEGGATATASAKARASCSQKFAGSR